MDAIFTPDNLVALLTLTSLEIVLGIDNIVFIAILVGKLPPHQRDRARIIGLALAMFMRIGLLFAVSWLMKLEEYRIGFTIPVLEYAPNWKDAVLFLGGLFLVAKATYEVHHKVETGGPVEAVPHDHAAAPAPSGAPKRAPNFSWALVQILMLDLVFSVDSVITAVGMAKELWVMVTAVVIAVGVMLAFSGFVARFVDRHPTIKMLALSFLILIGVMLIAESTGQHIKKGYIYFAMAFSLGVEMLNIWAGTRAEKKRAALRQT